LTGFGEFDRWPCLSACDTLWLHLMRRKLNQALLILARTASDKRVRVNVASHSGSPGFFSAPRYVVRAGLREATLSADGAHLSTDTGCIFGNQVVVRRLVSYGPDKNIRKLVVRTALSDGCF
jgi:hypothetical protein